MDRPNSVGRAGTPALSSDLPVPTGVQRLLRLAAVEPAFLQTLAEHRDEAARAAGVRLSTAESTMLRAIPAPTLAQMVRALPPPPSARLPLLRRTAATAVVLLGGAVLADCSAGCKRGGPAAADATASVVASDADAEPPEAEAEVAADGTAGVEPDRDAGEALGLGVTGPDRSEFRVWHTGTASRGGIAPDMPAARSTGFRLAATEIDGPLDAGVVRRVILQHRPRFLDCAERAAIPAARVVLHIVIEAAGRVAQAVITGNEGGSEFFEECLVSAANGMQFPPASSPTRVDQAVELSTREGGATDPGGAGST